MAVRRPQRNVTELAAVVAAQPEGLVANEYSMEEQIATEVVHFMNGWLTTFGFKGVRGAPGILAGFSPKIMPCNAVIKTEGGRSEVTITYRTDCEAVVTLALENNNLMPQGVKLIFGSVKQSRQTEIEFDREAAQALYTCTPAKAESVAAMMRELLIESEDE